MQCSGLILMCSCIVTKVFLITTNKMQISLIIFSKALHVSGSASAHHQEHITAHSASGIVSQYCCRLVSWMGRDLGPRKDYCHDTQRASLYTVYWDVEVPIVSKRVAIS